MAVLTNTMMQGTAAISDDAAYQIERSLRFDNPDEAYLQRTANTQNKRTFTVSGWFKKSMKGQDINILGQVNPSGWAEGWVFFVSSGDQLTFYNDASGGSAVDMRKQSLALLRDPSAWYHGVAVVDTTNAVAADRVRIYLNGRRIETFGQSTDPAQNLEVLSAPATNPYNIGYQYEHSDGYIADVQFIDGLALSPAAFAKRDSSGAWNPTALSIPAPNQNITWNTGSTNCTNPGNAFDGSSSTYAEANASGAKATITIPSTTAQDVRMHISSATAGEVYINNQQVNTWSSNPSGWINCPWNGKPITSIGFRSASQATCYRVEFDGSTLITGTTDYDTRNNPNNGTVWSNTFTGTFHSNGQGNAVNTFDGSLDSQSFGADASTLTFLPPSTITANTKIEIYVYTKGSITGQNDLKVNNSSIYSAVNTALGNDAWGWYDIGKTLNSTHGLVVGRHDNNNKVNIKAIKVDGHVLIDSTYDNSFHLKFNDISRNLALGKDTLNGKIADATGGKPLYAVTDEWGDVKASSGFTADSNASTLIGAYPLVTQVDVHADIKGSGSNTNPTDGSAGAPTYTTDDSRFYGTSAYFFETDGITFSDSIFTADFKSTGTVEWWAKVIEANQYTCFYKNNSGATDRNEISYEPSGSYAGLTWRPLANSGNNVTLLSAADFSALAGTGWHHYVWQWGGGNAQFYLDGLQKVSTSCTPVFDNKWEWGDAYTPTAGSTGSNYYCQDIKFYESKIYSGSFKPPKRNDFPIVNNLNHNDGTDTSLSVASATGAKPIHTVTDTYGETKGSGYATDPLAEHIHFAFAGDDLADHNGITNRTTGAITLTNAGQNVTNTTDQAKYYGTSAFFNGESWLETNLDANVLKGNWTVEAWIYWNGANYASNMSMTIIGHWGNSNGTYGWQLTTAGSQNKQLGFVFRKNGDAGGTAYSILDPDDLVQNEWVHVAVSGFDGGGTEEYKLFKNGKKVGQMDFADQIHAAGTICVGNRETSDGGYQWNGYINDLRIYHEDGNDSDAQDACKYRSDFTVPVNNVNPAAIDSVVDSPTNYTPDSGSDGTGGVTRGNYCTWNDVSRTGSSNTLSQGNLKCVTTTNACTKGTFIMSPTVSGKCTGKWYFEYTLGSGATQQIGIIDSIGMQDATAPGGAGHNGYIYLTTTGSANTGHLYYNGSASISTWPSGAKNNVVMIAYDAATGKLWWGKDGTWFNDSSGNTGNPAAGTYPAITVDAAYRGRMVPVVGAGGGSDAANGNVNFGQRAYAHSAPTDFRTLCTQNLPDTFSGAEVNNPSKYVDSKLWTGDGVDGKEVRGFDFGPDFLWMKSRNTEISFILQDQVRGVGNTLDSDNADPAGTGTGYVESFESDGFDLEGSGGGNTASRTYVGHGWDAGTTNSGANNNGSINISAGNQWVNATAGFSITKYEGTEAAATVGHGLNVPPELIIVKNLETADSMWEVYHKDLGVDKTLRLNDGAAETGSSTAYWNSTAPTNTVFSLKDSWYTNDSGVDHIAYCWASIPGFSSIGSYLANNSAEGPFIHLGFRPQLILLKNNQRCSWVLTDDVRNKVNFASEPALMHPNNPAHEGQMGSGKLLEFLSNGFKIRSTNCNINYTNTTDKIIYAAWARNPFKTARAF